MHSTLPGGHSGIQATYQRIERTFYWPNMKGDIQTLLQTCDVCQRSKPEHCKSSGLLQPLHLPAKPFPHLTMDFIEGLPKSEGKDSILVVVDRFTKYSCFVGLTHPFFAAKVAKEFLDKVVKLHGLPECIVTDRDKVFTSPFWQELLRTMGVDLHMSLAYHPQSDGQTKGSINALKRI